MVLFKASMWAVVVAGAVLAAITQYLAYRVEQRFPPAGSFTTVDGVRLHYIDEPAGERADLAAMVFIHGAGGNARDLHGVAAETLRGRARMIFVDRPGAGYSQRGGAENADPQRQAGLIAGLMRELGIEKAVVIGHSFGAAVALALALARPDTVAGLALVAPASNVWPGGKVTWYYRLAAIPFLGRIFVETLAVPVGSLRYRGAVAAIFDPEAVPADYARRSGTRLVLRPGNFRSNARDVSALYENVRRLSARYARISAPTVIITGDTDSVVSPDFHARRLAAEIAGARLVELENTGHMPAHTRPDILVAEIERLNRRAAESQSEEPAGDDPAQQTGTH